MEVLVTLVILSLGILAILTLFPLAASQMAIAVREDRSAQTAAAGDAYFRAYWKTQIVEKGDAFAAANEPLYAALRNPNAPTPPTAALPLPASNEWSYPVVADPMGYFARGGQLNQTWVGDLNGGAVQTNVPRRNLNSSLVATAQAAMRICSLPDGFSYDDDGRPKNPATGLSEREWRYNCFWVVQRPLDQSSYAAMLTIVVFDKRAPLYAPVGAEAVFSAVFTPTGPTTTAGATSVVPVSVGSTMVTVTNNANGPPDVKPGGWVMDATVGNVNNVAPSPTVGPRPTPLRHANFYQVVSVTPGPAAGQTTLELQIPVKATSDAGLNPLSGYTYSGTLVVLTGVSGVYSRSPLGAGN
jgi:hypothetical protein